MDKVDSEKDTPPHPSVYGALAECTVLDTVGKREEIHSEICLKGTLT